jgi:hypothetical protein
MSPTMLTDEASKWTVRRVYHTVVAMLQLCEGKSNSRKLGKRPFVVVNLHRFQRSEVGQFAEMDRQLRREWEFVYLERATMR